ncbi:MAG: sulfatase-like hydrolase/transferase, partial [Planctomycetota bacterium]
MKSIGQNRREFLKSVGGAAGLVLLPEVVFGGRKTTRKPNIIVIMSDEHNASVTGSYGNDIVRTPNLDGLSRKGVTFDSCYCNSPLCVPSRLSFTSGKYVSRVGAWSNSCWLENADCPSLPRIMNAAGYESVLCGKMHYDRTRRYGFREIGGNMNNSRKTGKGGRRKASDLTPKAGMSGRFDNFHTGDKSSILTHDRKV